MQDVQLDPTDNKKMLELTGMMSKAMEDCP